MVVSDAIGRREAIRRSALILGGALSASSIAGVLAGCGARNASEGWKPRALDAGQIELVATIAEHIIPETDTPGARAAAVHRFVDTMLAEYYLPQERQRFVAGLADVDERARRQHGNTFLKCDPKQQRAVLEELDREAFPARSSEPTFMRTMKELTVLGYYTSEPGATKELEYVGVPGRFQGCVPFAAIGRPRA